MHGSSFLSLAYSIMFYHGRASQGTKVIEGLRGEAPVTPCRCRLRRHNEREEEAGAQPPGPQSGAAAPAPRRRQQRHSPRAPSQGLPPLHPAGDNRGTAPGPQSGAAAPAPRRHLGAGLALALPLRGLLPSVHLPPKVSLVGRNVSAGILHVVRLRRASPVRFR